MGQASDSDIRISNAERDEAVSTLGMHLSTGRLELEEFEVRCDRASAARTRGELEALFSDLPVPHPDLSSAAPPATLAASPAGELVRKPKDKSKSDELVATSASSAFTFIGGMTFTLGIPGAILATVFLNAWWVFIPVVVVMIVAGGLAESAKKPRSET